VEFEASQWGSWPRGGAAPAGTAPHEEVPEIHEISTDFLVGQAVDRIKDWEHPPREKTAEFVPDDSPSITAENIWRHRDAHPYVLLLLFLDRYGEESVYWLPDTAKLTLERDGTTISNSAFTKLMAARTLLATPSPWRQWEVFHWVTRGLAGLAPNFTYLEEPEIRHMFVGADLMKMVDPTRETSIEVDKYIAATFRNEGIHYAPEPLAFAQREIEQPQLHCTACDAIHRDDNDVRCVTCGSTHLKKLPYDFAASRDQTKTLWEARKNLPLLRAVDGLPDTGTGNAVYRLLVDWDYARHVRAQMVQQLRLIGGK
jgi:hypothetical protein